MAEGDKPKAVFTIREIPGKKSLWRRIGSAWVNKDGSINVILDALPIDGKLNIREDIPYDASRGGSGSGSSEGTPRERATSPYPKSDVAVDPLVDDDDIPF